MWTEAIDCPAEVAVSTLDEIVLLHVRFDSLVDRCYGSMEKAVVEITVVFVLHIFPSACRL